MAEGQNKGEHPADTGKPAEPAVVVPLVSKRDEITVGQAQNYLAQRNAPTVILADENIAVTEKPVISPAGSASPFIPKPDAPPASTAPAKPTK